MQGGFDRHLVGALWGGLFSTLAMGRYDTLQVRLGKGLGTESIRARAFHFWFFMGARFRLRS
ncbi:hypothetical protein DRW03_12125 [Corallococcus sp. H22C18031201]|nr:hypothetical protein DRW03_12125 [Corallococcus sp. H22C18031201]